jgi:hypothetical protein
MEALLLGTVVYLKLPGTLQAQVPGNKPFARIDLQAAGQSQGLDFGALSQSTDPTSGLGYLYGASDNVTKVGNETLRGAKTTHYKATVDLQKAELKMTPEQKQAVEKVRTQLGTSTFPVDAWIDGAGRVRKMTYAIDMSKAKTPAGQPAGTGQTIITVELFDYGTAVNVAEPPADQVADMTKQASGTG